mmetsp:Transcript_41067/g.80384  ORF Transcript_41067/g.80384 Transcript_41067/m.80384 type:complete len:383 (+) Transcript_41067:139-1287(+)
MIIMLYRNRSFERPNLGRRRSRPTFSAFLAALCAPSPGESFPRSAVGPSSSVRRPHQSFCARTAAAVDDDTGLLPAYENAYALRPKGREFLRLLGTFTSHPPSDVASLLEPTHRALFTGAVSALDDPPVVRAFVVLYEDLAPLRVAGRMIFNFLEEEMERSVSRRDGEVVEVAERMGIDEGDVGAGRRLFSFLAGGGGELGVNDLVESGVADTILELSGYKTFDAFSGAAQESGEEGALTFEDFMMGLRECTEEGECVISDLVEDVMEAAASKGSVNGVAGSDEARVGKTAKYHERYDLMLEKFEEWEPLFAGGVDQTVTGETKRRQEVLRGCFVGARNEDIVEALRIVYVQYSALRFSGDLIFKLMTKVVDSQKRKAGGAR